MCFARGSLGVLLIGMPLSVCMNMCVIYNTQDNMMHTCPPKTNFAGDVLDKGESAKNAER